MNFIEFYFYLYDGMAINVIIVNICYRLELIVGVKGRLGNLVLVFYKFKM